MRHTYHERRAGITGARREDPLGVSAVLFLSHSPVWLAFLREDHS